MSTRIHVGCGSVYLEGWLNVDVRGPKTFLAADRPDLVEKWRTTEDNYFAKHRDVTIESLRAGPLDQEYVCDHYGSFEQLPGNYWDADEVLAVHSFEHLSETEAHRALDHIDSMMKSGGVLRIDVPDHEETLRLFRSTGDEFYIRHLLGPRRGPHGFHMCSYTSERLRSLVEGHGFVYEAQEANRHLYPSTMLRFRKPGPRPPYEYIPIDIPVGAKMLDCGPGGHAHPRADVYLDKDPANVRRLQRLGKTVIMGDIESGLPEIPDKAYDIIWASHIFEHLENPRAAAATLSRIGKSGIVVMPSAAKEALTGWEERSHLWSVLDNPDPCKPPIFIRAKSERLDQMRSTDVQKILSRAFRTGPSNRIDEEGRHLRKWWHNTEPLLDVVYRWKDSLDLLVIG